MGWTSSSEWASRQEMLDDYAGQIRRTGYSVTMSGNWLYAEKHGNPADLVYVMAKKIDGEWGYKDISVSCGPLCYTAPLNFVLKVHGIFKDNEFYQGWLSKYPNRKQVFESEAQYASLFEEGAA